MSEGFLFRVPCTGGLKGRAEGGKERTERGRSVSAVEKRKRKWRKKKSCVSKFRGRGTKEGGGRKRRGEGKDSEEEEGRKEEGGRDSLQKVIVMIMMMIMIIMIMMDNNNNNNDNDR